MESETRWVIEVKAFLSSLNRIFAWVVDSKWYDSVGMNDWAAYNERGDTWKKDLRTSLLLPLLEIE